MTPSDALAVICIGFLIGVMLNQLWRTRKG